MSDLDELLSKSFLFGGIDDSTRREIAKHLREITFSSGAMIFQTNDPGNALYIIREGQVRVSVMSAEGRQISFRRIGVGEILGEIAVLDGGPRAASATALTNVRALSLSRANFEAVAERHPMIYRAALRFVCERLRRTSEQLEAIALYPLEVRIARLLLSIAERDRKVVGATSVRLSLGMSQSELALLIGATRPRVNDALAVLEADGAIKREGSNIVCNLERLTEVAEIDNTSV